MKGMAIKFRCPVCNQYIASVVNESYPGNDGYERRRECESCGAKFVTVEKVEYVVRSK